MQSEIDQRLEEVVVDALVQRTSEGRQNDRGIDVAADLTSRYPPCDDGFSELETARPHLLHHGGKR